MKRRNRAFTLIELLVVVSIISLLSSVALAALNSARDKAKIARTKQELAQFAKAADVAEGESYKTLMTITGSTCSDCPCRGIGSLINISSSHACYTNWINVVTTVQNNTNGIVTGLTNMTRDPWGSPYALDENQGEAGTCGTRDSFRSAGPNGIWGDGDDLIQEIPLPPKCP